MRKLTRWPTLVILATALSVSACDAVRSLVTRDEAGTDSGTALGSAPTAASKAGAAAGTGDPCDVLPVATLEQLTGLKALASKPILGKSKNGCRWANGVPGVAYDVLPMAGSPDDLIARMNQGASRHGVTFKKVDLGNGHVGAVTSAPTPTVAGMPTTGTVDLFLGDRYAVIMVTLPAGSDVATVTMNVARAFSGAAARLPPAPDMGHHE
jgi:hypothetical protein